MTELIKGDKLFDLEFTVKDADGNAVDLTNATVKFKMRKYGATTLKVNGTCTITDATNGKCKYTVQDGDLDTVGTYQAELEITYSDGKIITATLEDIKVISDLP